MSDAASSLNFRRIAAALFVLGFLLRLLVPGGWMPAYNGHTLTLAPCSGWADPLTTMVHGQAHEDHHGTSSEKSPGGHGKSKPDTSAPCAFAASAPHVPIPEPAAPVVVPIAEQLLPSFAAALVTIGRGLVAPPPPSTGPPSRA